MSASVSNVKGRALWHDWLICEIMHAVREYKGGEEEKSCCLKFESIRDFLPMPCNW